MYSLAAPLDLQLFCQCVMQNLTVKSITSKHHNINYIIQSKALHHTVKNIASYIQSKVLHHTVKVLHHTRKHNIKNTLNNKLSLVI